MPNTAKLFLRHVFYNIFKRQCSDSPKKPGSGAEILGELGRGAGKGGGAGGSIREAGGGIGKYGAAKEEEYFYRKQKQQLEALNKKLVERRKVCRDQGRIRRMEEVIEENRKLIAQLEKCFRSKEE